MSEIEQIKDGVKDVIESLRHFDKGNIQILLPQAIAQLEMSIDSEAASDETKAREIELSTLQMLGLIAAAQIGQESVGKAGYVTAEEWNKAMKLLGVDCPVDSAQSRAWALPIVARVLALPAPPSDDARLVMRVGWTTGGQAKDGGTEPEPGARDVAALDHALDSAELRVAILRVMSAYRACPSDLGRAIDGLARAAGLAGGTEPDPGAKKEPQR